MKNLSLLVTLGLISIFGAITPVNANPEEAPISETEAIQYDENGNPILSEEVDPAELPEEAAEVIEPVEGDIPTADDAADASSEELPVNP